MMEQNEVREQFKKVITDCGVRAKFIAKKLGWDYFNMIKFKNGQYDYPSDRLKEFKSFLDKYDSSY